MEIAYVSKDNNNKQGPGKGTIVRPTMFIVRNMHNHLKAYIQYFLFRWSIILEPTCTFEEIDSLTSCRSQPFSFLFLDNQI